MYTSDNLPKNEAGADIGDSGNIIIERLKMTKISFGYIWVSCFCVLFGAVYEYFSHEVYSYYMLYAFVFPLAGGVLPFLALSLKKEKGSRLPGDTPRLLWHFGIATLTVGSIVTGILEIYGTTNSLTAGYWYAGFGLLAAAVCVYLFERRAQ